MDSRFRGNPANATFEVEKYPFYLLNRTISRYNAIIATRLRGIGLDIPSWRVLMVLGSAEQLSLGELSDSTAINLSTLMRTVQKMERAKLIKTSEAVDDRRITLIALAAYGRERLAVARKTTSPVYETAIAGFTERDFDKLVASINKLHTNLENES